MKKIFVSVFVIIFFLTPTLYAEKPPSTECSKSDTKITDDNSKYSMFADIDGFVSFNEIGCSIEWRNRELCAMEMIAFDTTAKVFDFISGDEIAMSEAYFAISVDLKKSNQIVAFKHIADCKKHIKNNSDQKIVTYDELIDMQLNLKK